MQEMLLNTDELNNNGTPYIVLARKYRPQKFAELVGQESLVRTITNALTNNKFPHALILTGIRGVGKTTIARIIAKALNCLNLTEVNGVLEPCNNCANCLSIIEDRNQDVIEMDAASHTGVGDVREIIENCRYRPTSGKYKVYIIDEVHMLSNSAFNALLKTLEEPASHVKFIFATTEIRKVPLTILSRCMRFNLRRLNVEELASHFADVLNKENITPCQESLKIIASCAEGSVRDGLSILEQAIAHTNGSLDPKSVRDMLGMADSDNINELVKAILECETSKILEICKKLYSLAYEPLSLLNDITEIFYVTCKCIVDPSYYKSLLSNEEHTIRSYADKLDVARIARIWELLNASIYDIKNAHRPFNALEMTLIRIAHLSKLPAPEELLKQLKGGHQASSGLPQSITTKTPANAISLKTNSEVLQALYDADEMLLHHHLKTDAEIKSVEPGKIEIGVLPHAPKTIAGDLRTTLERITSQKWIVISKTDENIETISMKQDQKMEEKKAEIRASEVVQDILNVFTELEIADIKVKNAV